MGHRSQMCGTIFPWREWQWQVLPTSSFAYLPVRQHAPVSISAHCLLVATIWLLFPSRVYHVVRNWGECGIEGQELSQSTEYPRPPNNSLNTNVWSICQRLGIISQNQIKLTSNPTPSQFGRVRMSQGCGSGIMLNRTVDPIFSLDIYSMGLSCTVSLQYMTKQAIYSVASAA